MSATTASAVDRLSRLSEEDFREVVDVDLRREATPDEAAALRSPALVDRWLTHLLAVAKSVEAQLAARGEDWTAKRAQLSRRIAEQEARLEDATEAGNEEGMQRARVELRQLRRAWNSEQERYSKSRAGTFRFKGGLEEWIIEARNIRDSTRDRLYDTVVAEERNRYARRVWELEQAIEEHRKAHPSNRKVLAADEALWRLIGG